MARDSREESHRKTSAPRRASDDLEREQAVLDRAYDELSAMRARTSALLADLRDAGKPDPDLEFALVRRVALLADTGRPLCFGRIDREEGTTWYLGRRHVEDRRGDPVVIEWRVPAAAAFYQASPDDPNGLVRRRQFLLDGRTLVSYADDLFGSPQSGERGESELPRLRGGDALLAELERARSGVMADIVATIQLEQDAVIRAPLEGVLAVQGGPGTGKTAIGLHRVAYLLYNHPALAEAGVLVVGPSRTFLRYVAQVLPSLGEEAVAHVALGDLVAGAAATTEDPPPLARLKGDARMAEVLAAALASRRRPAGDDLVIELGLALVRVPAATVDSLAGKLAAQGGPYRAGRAALSARLVGEAHRAALRTGHLGAERGRVAAATRSSGSFAAVMDRVWPAVSAKALVGELLESPSRIAAAAEGILGDAEVALLAAGANERRRGRWSAGDLALLDEAEALVSGRGRAYGHVVVDEAQDLTPMQLRMIARRCPAGSLTVLGDLAQATGPVLPDGWDAVVAHLPRPDGWRYCELMLGYRAPAPVLDFASRLLPYTAPGLRRTVSVRPGRYDLAIVSTAPKDLASTAAARASELAAAGFLVGCIAPRDKLRALGAALARLGTEHGLAERDGLGRAVTLIAAEGAKGLEFDAAVVVEPAAIAELPGGLRLLYVALSRPIQQLTVVHAAPLPGPLLPSPG